MNIPVRTFFAAILLTGLFIAGCDFGQEDEIFIGMDTPTLGQELTMGQSFQVSGVVRSGSLVDHIEVGLFLASSARPGDVDTLDITPFVPPSPAERVEFFVPLTVPDQVEQGEGVLYFVSVDVLGHTLSREVLIEEPEEE